MAELSEAQISSRKRWADALLGGEYRQGTGALRKGNLFCCLGVACDLSSPDGWRAWDNTDFLYSAGDNKTMFIPPLPVLEEFGLTESEAASLAGWNDRGGRFEEIAAAILGEGEALADPDEA